MNYIKAETIKLLKSPFIWILSTAYIFLCLLVFYQYTLNTSANVIEPLLKNPINLYSFFLIMFAAFFNVIFAVTLGSQVVAKDFINQTMPCLIQSAGRYKSFFAKMILLFLISVAFSLLLIALDSFRIVSFWLFRRIFLACIAKTPVN